MAASILRDASLRDAPQDEVSDPHGEERVFARLRTMLRIALRTMRPRKNRQFSRKSDNAPGWRWLEPQAGSPVLTSTQPLILMLPSGCCSSVYSASHGMPSASTM